MHIFGDKKLPLPFNCFYSMAEKNLIATRKLRNPPKIKINCEIKYFFIFFLIPWQKKKKLTLRCKVVKKKVKIVSIHLYFLFLGRNLRKKSKNCKNHSNNIFFYSMPEKKKQTSKFILMLVKSFHSIP